MVRRHCPPERRRYHAALYDALAGALLLLTLLRRPELGSATIPWLLQMSTLDGDQRDALQQGDLFLSKMEGPAPAGPGLNCRAVRRQAANPTPGRDGGNLGN